MGPLVFTLLFWVLTSPALAENGHAVRSSQVVIDSRLHWQNWEFSSGTLDISAAGEVTPRRWRKSPNAVLDIVENLRRNPPPYLSGKNPEEFELLDAIQAGSNRQDVVNLFDGNMDTYWEPDPPSGEAGLAAQWWFTVDLGQLALASKVILRFVDRELGDPFLLFDVLTSDGQKPISALASQALDFERVYQTIRPNSSERLIEIDLENLPRLQHRKRVVRLLQVVVTGSALERGREVSQEEYERLRTEAPGDTGIVEYTKLLANGSERRVPADVFAELEENRRGTIRYYRRERPRLAEVEVITDGDNVLADAIERGGSITASDGGQFNSSVLVDSDALTNLALKVWIPVTEALLFGNVRQEDVFVDLGGFFWIEGHRMAINFRPSAHSGSWGDYWVDFSDGSREVDGTLSWIRRVESPGFPGKTGALGGLHLYSHDFNPVKARFMRIYYTASGDYPSGPSTVYLSDIQLFGDGFQPEVTLTSDLIRLGGSRNLTTIEWDADTPPGTRVALQTRTGNTLDTLLHYFKKDGTEITEAQYNKIRIASQKGDIVSEQVASADWEPWSAPYEAAAGSPVTSPSPREFVKIRATLLSEDPGIHSTLKAVRLNFSDPVAGKLEGWLLPNRVEELGEKQEFSLIVDVKPPADAIGELLLKPPPGMEIAFDPATGFVYAGRTEDLTGENRGLRSFAVADVRVLASGDSLHLAFTPVEPGAEAIRVDFNGTMYSAGGRLHGSMRSGGGLWQRVDEKFSRNSLQVLAVPGRRKLFGQVAIPRAFSPNGDGLNDELRLDFTLFLAPGRSPVMVEVFDLRGRCLRRLVRERAVSTGEYTIPWDGRDHSGDRVAPGLYAIRLSLDSDLDETGLLHREIVRTVAVAY